MRALAVLILWSAVAQADPVLRVRARTRLEVERIRRSPSHEAGRVALDVRGRWVDAVTGEAVVDHTVAIAIKGKNDFYNFAEPTGPEGNFAFFADLKPGEYKLWLVAGRGDDDLYDPPPPIERALNLSRTTPVIALSAPEDASVAQPSIRIELATSDPDDQPDSSSGALRPIELPVALLVDGKHVDAVETHGGRIDVDLPTASLGKPGALARITAHFGGDLLRNPAEATRTVRVTTPTQLSLTADGGELAWRGTLGLSGQLTDALGPVAEATVNLVATDDDTRPLATARTDGAGRFRTQISGGAPGSERPGPLFVEARFHSGPSFREPSRSAAVSIRVLAPLPNPLGFWLPPLLTLVAIASVVLARRRPWRALSVRRRAARRVARMQPAEAGFTASRPRLLSSLRPANDHGLSGQVLELPWLHPLPTATVQILAGGVTRPCAVDERGRFVADDLPPGEVTVEASAPGFVPERWSATLPHRGELRGVRVTLLPIREKIFATYKAVAVPLLPEPRLAETWTPRELVAHVARRTLIVDELRTFTQLVEVACFGARLPDAAVLAEAERLAAACRMS